MPKFLLLLAGSVLQVAPHDMKPSIPEKSAPAAELATLGGGCFWCLEAIFQTEPGVLSVTSGFAGGTVPNPDYETVCTGRTGHAEVIQIRFDPARVGYGQLLDLFWRAHDPTTRDRQGADMGTQYRSIILWHTAEQKRLAEESRRKAAARFSAPIVTELAPFTVFYSAEGAHQDYFRKNPNAPYCRAVIAPKLEKIRKP